MATTGETEVIVGETEVHKRVLSPRARTRLALEALCLAAYSDSPHLPRIRDFDAATLTLTTERVVGRSFREVFNVDDEWTGAPTAWDSAAGYLGQYIDAETDLLSRGLMYRDLNLGHLLFTGEKAVFVDHEETVGKPEGSAKWRYNSYRGTWETMAPEEFPGCGYLTERTATYRSAVLAHLALSGSLPFPRFEDRDDVHGWRRSHPPEIASSFDKPVRKVLRAALDSRIARRHENPQQFFNELTASYEDTV